MVRTRASSEVTGSVRGSNAGLPQKVVALLDRVRMDDRDTKGDVYEYMLGKIATARQNGQFRTPRHIIKLMVEMTEPRADDLICDPVSGTCGFLVAAGEYLRDHRPEVLHDAKARERFNRGMFDPPTHFSPIGPRFGRPASGVLPRLGANESRAPSRPPGPLGIQHGSPATAQPPSSCKPSQDHVGIARSSGTSSAESWYRAIVAVVAQAK